MIRDDDIVYSCISEPNADGDQVIRMDLLGLITSDPTPLICPVTEPELIYEHAVVWTCACSECRCSWHASCLSSLLEDMRDLMPFDLESDCGLNMLAEYGHTPAKNKRMHRDTRQAD